MSNAEASSSSRYPIPNFLPYSQFESGHLGETGRLSVGELRAMKTSAIRDKAEQFGDYLFGRDALIGVASLMLLVISGYATWSGMSDFIIGVSSAGVGGREIIGGYSVTNEALVVAIVATLTLLMWMCLRETFRPGSRLIPKGLITFILYAFLALWSVGFGYGFWWSLIAGQEATRTSMSNLQEDARDSSAVVAARLDAVKLQLDSVVSWSDSQMAREEASGGSCGVSSGAGRGPLYNARSSVRDSVASLRDNISQSWITPVQNDIEVLRKAASRLEGGTVEDRQQRFEAMAASIRGRAKSIAARSNSIGQSTAGEMRALAQSVSVKPGQAGFSCYDPTLAQRLLQAAGQAEKPAVLNLREAAFNEGPAGVANAVKRMWAKIADLASFAVSGGKNSGAVSADAGFTGRDLIALLATLGIDLGLFVLTVINPPPLRHTAFKLSATDIARTRRAVETALTSKLPDDKGVNLGWVRRHIINHIGRYGRTAMVLSPEMYDTATAKNTASFLIIPNLGSIPRKTDGTLDEREERRALAINQVAGILTDKNIIRALSEREINYARKEMTTKARTRMADQEADNIGLIAKAHRALEMAEWSAGASDDPEIFRLVDANGLLPLLKIINEKTDHKYEEEYDMMN